MDSSKMAFITCVNEELMYQKSLKFINRLDVPEGIEIECIRVKNPSSLTMGYNLGMMNTQAKYKVYLHQDVYILHKNFIRDVMALCQSNEEIGILGVIGARTLPHDGIWWKTYNGAGKVYDSHTGQMGIINLNHSTKPVEHVVCVDGLLMVTQYDLPWREELFDGWHFYDISQCFEFRKAGYEVAIPYQKMPWCIHDCGIVNLNGYDHYREIFLKNYIKIDKEVGDALL